VARSAANQTTPAIVTELMPLGPFATWQAERAVGDYDRNTLRLGLDPRGDPPESNGARRCGSIAKCASAICLGERTMYQLSSPQLPRYGRSSRELARESVGQADDPSTFRG
jgi:hypothetical protein